MDCGEVLAYLFCGLVFVWGVTATYLNLFKHR